MTGYGTIETAIEAIKNGAEDYLTKPFDYEAVRKKIARLMEVMELRERVAQLEGHLERHTCFENIIAVSAVMERVLERARLAAATDAAILIVGETGTGKEMLARAIHQASPRARMPFVAVNSGALPRELVESELFGFRRGAFTGAYADAPGIFSAASGGTVFLDEIGEMPKDVQVKLLRVLHEGELRPVGSTKAVHIDVRVVSATNRRLNELRSTLLREDLYFRIATVVLQVPPLRARQEDILVLTQHFAVRLSRRYGREVSLSRGALELLLRYPFPGNVRELESLIESAAAVSADNPQSITDKDLRPLLSAGAGETGPAQAMHPPVSMEEMERLTIQQALRMADGNRTNAASLLGISRDTLYRKLRQYQG
jgi:DNA-binding NtrC family response regulator